MKKFFASFIALCMILGATSVFVSCSTPTEESAEASGEASENQTDAPTDAPTEKPTEKPTDKNEPTDELNILFIGNSYTFYHNMATTIFRGIATNAGYRANVTEITCGGYTLAKFANPNDTYGSQVARELDPKNFGKYDYVVLQEQSLSPALDSDRHAFFSAVRELCANIKAIGAEPVLYSTWGRKDGSSELSSNGWTNETMTWRLDAAYSAIGEELDIKVAHVGLAFLDINLNVPEIDLYDSDRSHPSVLGSYLAAATILATVLDCDPRDIEYSAGINEDVRAILNEAAYNAYENTPTVPDEYQVSPY